MLRRLSGIVKWLIHTNLYIALAAVCFQLVIVVLVDHIYDWNWILTVHTFFSTLMVYQISRWIFHKNIRDHDFKRDELYTWLDHHPKYTLTSAVVGGIITIGTVFFLKWQTVMILGGLGVISVLYPVRFNLKGKEFSIRSIPFAKIFLIALVWAGTSVWVPLSELGYPPFEHLDRFGFHFLFILFITLPFDIVDLPNDSITSLKTIPAWLGIKRTKALIVCMAIVLIAYESLRMIYSGPFIADYLAGYILLIVTLLFYAVTLDKESDKWKIMAVYDGSMIALFLITLILHQYA